MAHGLFEAWFYKRLLPALPRDAVVGMDNASFHRKDGMEKLAKEAGRSLLFLPPYSPELNPIEHYWGWLKRQLRKILPSFTSFDEALDTIFNVA